MNVWVRASLMCVVGIVAVIAACGAVRITLADEWELRIPRGAFGEAQYERAVRAA